MKRIIIGASLILSFSACKHKGDILLRLKYDKGENLDVKYRTYIVTDNENDEPIKNEYERMSFSVDSVINDSAYVISAKFDYVRVKNKSFMNDEEYSSDQDKAVMSPRGKQLHEKFKPVLDSTYKLTVNKRGQLIKPFSFASGRKIPPAFAPIDYENYQIVFPREAVSIGDEWTNERPIPLTGGKRISTYHIESIYNSIIQIRVSGELEIGSGTTKEFSGLYLIDEKTKKLISAKIEMDANTFAEGKVKGVVSIESQNFPR